MSIRHRRSSRFVLLSALLAVALGAAIAMPAVADTLFPPTTGAFTATVATGGSTYTYVPVGSPPTSTGPTINGVVNGQSMNVGIDGSVPPNATLSAFSRLRVRQCKGGTTVNNLADFDPYTTNKCTSVPLGAGSDFVDSGQLVPGTTAASVAFKAGIGTAPDTISGFDGSTLPGFTCDATHPCQIVLNVQVTSGIGSNNFLSFPINFAAAATAPSAPMGANAVAGNAQATVAWAAPASNGGSPITGYTVTSTPGGRTCTTSGALTCTVSGLTNGTAYTFTVKASNAIGAGPASAPSNSVTPSAPATVPGAPMGANAVAGNAQATVAWAAPASNGGSPITGYTVTSTPGGRTCTTSGALTCTVSGLTNGTAYTFTVKASNAIGAGPASAPSNSVTPSAPATVPGAPMGANAVAGNAQATVAWAAPASNGGSPITGYTVTSTPGGRTCTTSGALTCTVSGLTNGTAYTFTVKASNAIGAGPASAPSNSVTPMAPTNGPPIVDAGPAVAGTVNTPITLNGSATDPDGDPLTITWSVNSASCTILPSNAAHSSITCSTPGVFSATLTASDGVNPPVSDSTAVTISNQSDTTRPECALISASSTGISVRTSDRGSGLASVEATIAKNATVTVPVFPSGTTTDVVVAATKIKLGTSASVELTVTDVAGNTTVCDPILAQVKAGPVKTFRHVPAAEHLLTVSEAQRVRALVVEVNGIRRVLRHPDGKTFDLGQLSAVGNTVRIRVLGPTGSSAAIMIWDGQ